MNEKYKKKVSSGIEDSMDPIDTDFYKNASRWPRKSVAVHSVLQFQLSFCCLSMSQSVSSRCILIIAICIEQVDEIELSRQD